MAMRDLITGGANCGQTSSSNPFGALVNTVLGSSSKAQELKGLPGSSVSVPGSSSDFRPAPLSTLPGSEVEGQQERPNERASQILQDFRNADPGGFSQIWNENLRPHVHPHGQIRDSNERFAEFQHIYDHGVNEQQPVWDGPPQRVLANVFRSFVDSGRSGVPFQPIPLPPLGLSKADKLCIRDRTCIFARHIYADKSEEYIHAQVNMLLQSLDIDDDHRLGGIIRGPYPELEEYWNESQHGLRSGPMLHPADAWANEFHQQRENPEAWAHSFQQQYGNNDWVSEFQQEHSQMMNMRDTAMTNVAAMEQSRMLAQTLAQNNDPKFQNSKFLQFVSKMSRGELIIDDNQVKQSSGSLSGSWVEEYQDQHNASSSSWADQFQREELAGADKWVGEFSKEHHSVHDENWANEYSKLHEDSWANEFSKLHVGDWVEEFGQQASDGALDGDNWASAYDQYLNEQKSGAQNGIYVFSDMNPYVGHPNPLKEGQELFRKGLLSEAVLALEAEVLKNPDNAEGWRLLGVTHAENDDDQQAIAAMMRAHEADPSNLEVLLALGVSHTNELEQQQALRYLYKWIHNHPKYGNLVPPRQSDSLYQPDVIRIFKEAQQMSPDDADIHVVLGVLYNLSKEFPKAIESFRTALALKPNDYSLWNKLGATLANGVQCADAIAAYQQALDLKPNYVRAWANMGISYANQSLYLESIRYYVRALVMNPKADNAWQYLRISLSNASRNDMIQACDSRNLDLLQKEFPL